MAAAKRYGRPVIVGLFYLSLILLPFVSVANVEVSGRIVNNDTDQPALNGTVFLNNTLIAGIVQIDGAFVLKGVRPGHYDLVVALKACYVYKQIINVTDTALNLPDIAVSLKAMRITEDGQDVTTNWTGNFDVFRRSILGESADAGKCKILNPELLKARYDSLTRVLTARSEGFLIIENDVLGYRIKFLLSSFSYNKGTAPPNLESYKFFEEMDGSPIQKAGWETRRLTSYKGSAMNFFRSLIKRSTVHDGFNIFVPDTANHDQPGKFRSLSRVEIVDFVNKTAIAQQFALTIPDSLYVTFKNVKDEKIHDPEQASFSTLVKSNPAAYVWFDGNGSVVNAGGLEFKGYWKEQALPDLLPVDFDPQPKDAP